jgi:hypothetical protein
MKLTGDLNPLGIGSMPFKDIKFACDTMIDVYEKFPYWPQLPNVNNYENMYIQYAEALPGIVLKIEKGSIYVDMSRVTSDNKEEFYSNIIDDNVEYFKISNKFSIGVYFLKEFLENNKIQYDILKGHVTGPVSTPRNKEVQQGASIKATEPLRCRGEEGLGGGRPVHHPPGGSQAWVSLIPEPHRPPVTK